MDTTSISELPNNVAQSANNITMTQIEKPVMQMPQQTQQQITTQNMNQQIVAQEMNQQQMVPEPTQVQQLDNAANINSVLERARESGSLGLPNRDIPMNITQITNDNQALPDYIPNNKKDYMDEMIDLEELQDKRRRERNKEDSLEQIYKELQVPIFIAILYFIFLLPVTNKYFHKFFTFGFKDDGKMNLQGYLVKSFIFASTYYIFNLFMTKLSDL